MDWLTTLDLLLLILNLVSLVMGLLLVMGLTGLNLQFEKSYFNGTADSSMMVGACE
jgi:hypothetical protein